ncbi:hypothetical protein HJG60_010549 [Phyllostomus discolor]|uniref:Uncharacterized protein n=1 Tax=Phyllostomus discolor TaxID=89673 RepID=A0A834APJ2_9CHIR|nr:hypothetical protein HJG60_010549 [Phyllostomus discolor]
MVLPHCGSIREGGSEKEQWLLCTVLSGQKLPPSSRPSARHYFSPPHATRALQDAAPVLEPNMCLGKSMRSVRPFMRRGLRIPISSANPTTTGFYSQKLWGLIFLALEPWDGWSGVGLGSLTPEIPSVLYPPYMGLGPAGSTSAQFYPSTLPTRLDECGSLTPWLLVFNTA